MWSMEYSYVSCGTKFFRVLIFVIFSAIRKNKFLQTFFPQKFSPEKFSNLNSLHKNTVLRNCVCSITTFTCLFHSETRQYTMNDWFYIGYACRSSISVAHTQQKWKYYQCWVLGTFWKSQKLIPIEKNLSVLIAKVSSRKTKNRQSTKINFRKNFMAYGIGRHP